MPPSPYGITDPPFGLDQWPKDLWTFYERTPIEVGYVLISTYREVLESRLQKIASLALKYAFDNNHLRELVCKSLPKSRSSRVAMMGWEEFWILFISPFLVIQTDLEEGIEKFRPQPYQGLVLSDKPIPVRLAVSSGFLGQMSQDKSLFETLYLASFGVRGFHVRMVLENRKFSGKAPITEKDLSTILHTSILTKALKKIHYKGVLSVGRFTRKGKGPKGKVRKKGKKGTQN